MGGHICGEWSRIKEVHILDVLAKTPGLYLVPDLRYHCHCHRPCCCRRPCCCPPPRCHLPPRHHYHQEVDALDVIAKTPGLYHVPELRNLLIYIFWKGWGGLGQLGGFGGSQICGEWSQTKGVHILDVLAKNSGLYQVPKLRYAWFCCLTPQNSYFLLSVLDETAVRGGGRRASPPF